MINMNTITTRKNKSYTTIFIHAFDDETLSKAVDLRDRMTYAVIKPKESAVTDYLRLYNADEKIENAKNQEIGHKFEIAGFEFEKMEDMQGCHLSLRDIDAYNQSKLSDFGLIYSNDVLMENIFEKKTKSLMFC